MTEPVTKKNTSSSSVMPDWSLLPEELLHIVSTRLDNCLDVVHARSVCNSWRFAFPFPSFLLRPSYTLPMFSEFPRVTEDLCTLQKIPLFLFGVKTPDDNNEYFLLGGIGQYMLVDHIAERNRPSPIQWSLEVNISSCSDPFSINMDDCQILPIGHQYKLNDRLGYRIIDIDLQRRGFSCT